MKREIIKRQEEIVSRLQDHTLRLLCRGGDESRALREYSHALAQQIDKLATLERGEAWGGVVER